MEKNWLIRTKSNHILGPISKEKVLDLYNNGSIKPDDEVCSGNGYWFFIRETHLVDKYLLADCPQSFNPVSEAKSVLTASSVSIENEPQRDHVTRIGEIDLTKLNNQSSVVSAEIKISPEVPTPTLDKKKTRTQAKVKQSTISKPLKKQNYLRYLGIAAFLLLVLLIYYRKTILKSFFSPDLSLSPHFSLFISEAAAQDDSSIKKKSF